MNINIKTAEQLKTMTISQIGTLIWDDWRARSKSGIYFGARPYIQAMLDLQDINEKYGLDSARSIVNYFLANANNYRGDQARLIKAELKRRLATR